MTKHETVGLNEMTKHETVSSKMLKTDENTER
jgi:hypothetical protein